MKVSKIELSGVTTHEDTCLELPDTGIILISGGNGSGKSTVCEAVPWAVWGKSMRGTSLWSGKKGMCSVVIDGVKYTRSQKKPKLTWEGAPTFESDKDAQAALTEKMGPMLHWRRSCVISSTDGAGFAQATDAERKRMVEDVAGVSELEPAYQTALRKSREAEAQLAEAKSSLASTQASLERMRLVLSHQAPEEPPPLPERPSEEKLKTLKASAAEALAELQEARRASDNVKRMGQAAKQRQLDLERQLKEMEDTGECPTCHQQLPVDSDLQDRMTAETKKWGEERAQCRQKYEETLEELKDLEEESNQLAESVSKAREVHAGYSSAVAAHKAVQRAKEQREAAEKQVTELEAAVADGLLRVEEAEREVELRKSAAQVLSTKGVRAQIIDGVLSAIEQEANARLYRVCGDRMQLKLSAYGETQAGTRKEQVQFEIIGAGGGKGYNASSGGERRRIDVALALSLAMVAEASVGHDHSTIFLDEAYDALDDEGVEALTDELREIAKERCLVVIAHGAPLSALGAVATKHYSMVDNRLLAI